MPAIEARNLTKHYGSHAAVQDVSFRVEAGQTLVLLGPSGCGKTTLLRMLNRLVEPDSGAVLINGQDARSQPAERLRRGMGYVIQQVGLLPHYTVAENVAVVPRLLGHAPAIVAARTEELLARLHLPPERFAGQYPHQLSGGQQQRVGLARALAADPPIILLDEPFGALDPITRASIRREFRELPELRRKTMVLVTHDVTEAFELADQIMLLDAGRVQQLGPPRALLLRPANNFVRRFFAAEQLALQLRALRLEDVLAELQPAGEAHAISSIGSDTKPLSSTASIHDTLEQLSDSPTVVSGEPTVWVRVSETTARPLTHATLMAAFGRALRRLASEG
ncbi:ABC transporter ATP-binding protein [Hymenobacter actinosclerus]|uniref:Osmoprotectant transport system ATP-binding protein n=1 Tax=Hymenobacter actinosclerus TaxID=82805 RepID=A0A1I0EG54_9BACT|nr:ATP-binding cassette domain-containing protein [Hymenobacter actinosclerus]SET43544.1 osmoprotectant transport system ATP-binding protein [Hymenobacter actinosclerus]